MNVRTLGAIAAAVAVVASCSSSSGDSVDWARYSPAVRRRIEVLVNAGDCRRLQDEFNSADAANRDGINTDLMVYLNDQMDELGCYE